MKKNTKITLAQLIDRAEQRKGTKPEFGKFYIESLGGYVLVQKPTREQIEEITESERGDELYLYDCIKEPNLKDQNLQNAYGVKGLDIVEKIFEPGEIYFLAKEIVGMAGYSDTAVTKVNEVENQKN